MRKVTKGGGGGNQQKGGERKFLLKGGREEGGVNGEVFLSIIGRDGQLGCVWGVKDSRKHFRQAFAKKRGSSEGGTREKQVWVGWHGKVETPHGGKIHVEKWSIKKEKKVAGGVSFSGRIRWGVRKKGETWGRGKRHGVKSCSNAKIEGEERLIQGVPF